MNRVVSNPMPLSRVGSTARSGKSSEQASVPHGVECPDGFQDCLGYVSALYTARGAVSGQPKRSCTSDIRGTVLEAPLALFVPMGVPRAVSQGVDEFVAQYPEVLSHEFGDEGIRMLLPVDTIVTAFRPCPADRWPELQQGSLLALQPPGDRFIITIYDDRKVKLKELIRLRRRGSV